MLPSSAGVEPATSWSPAGRRIQLSHRGRRKKMSRVLGKSIKYPKIWWPVAGPCDIMILVTLTNNSYIDCCLLSTPLDVDKKQNKKKTKKKQTNNIKTKPKNGQRLIIKQHNTRYTWSYPSFRHNSNYMLFGTRWNFLSQPVCHHRKAIKLHLNNSDGTKWGSWQNKMHWRSQRNKNTNWDCVWAELC